MKVAVVHNLPSGGARRALVAHCRGLRRLGHRIEAFSPDTADEEFLPLAPVVDRTHLFAAPRPPGREASLFGRPGPLTAARALYLLAALARIGRRIAAAVDQGGFDVVLAAGDQYTHAPLALRHLRTPSCYFCQEPLRFVYDAPVGLPASHAGAVSGALRRVATLGLRRLLKPLDAGSVAAAGELLANSLFSHESILRAYGRPARVVYLGVDAGTFRPLGLPRERFVLSVGALHPAKGFDFVIAALSRIPEALRPPLVIVADRGYGGYGEQLQSHAARHGVSLEVRTRVAEEELVRIYNRAAAVVYAPYLEPFGLVALEAMACATPLVAVAEGGVRESVLDGNTGVLVPREEAALADAVARVLADPPRSLRLAEAGRAAVLERWTWEDSTRCLEKVLFERARARERAS